jgi:hypothetical protein
MNLNPTPTLPLNNKGRVKKLIYSELTPLPLDKREGAGGRVQKK